MSSIGYGQEQYQQAVRDMAAAFGEPETGVTLGRHLAENASQELHTIKQAPFQKPPLSDTHWPAVREYLLNQAKLPAAIVDQAHEEGVIYSDNRRNCVFLRERDKGAFIINTKDRPFARSLGHEDVPLTLPGSDKAVYLTDTPMEALSLKTPHPDSTILVTDEIPARDTPQPYLEGKTEIFLAQGRDKAVEEYARHLARRYPTVKRLLPTKGQSWHQEGLLHKEEKERLENVPLESNQFGVSMPGKLDERFSQTTGMGMGR